MFSSNEALKQRTSSTKRLKNAYVKRRLQRIAKLDAGPHSTSSGKRHASGLQNYGRGAHPPSEDVQQEHETIVRTRLQRHCHSFALNEIYVFISRRNKIIRDWQYSFY